MQGLLSDAVIKEMRPKCAAGMAETKIKKKQREENKKKWRPWLEIVAGNLFVCGLTFCFTIPPSLLAQGKKKTAREKAA